MTDLPTKSIILREFDSNFRFKDLFVPNVLLDTGSNASLISEKILEKTSFRIFRLTSSINLTNVMNQNSTSFIQGSIRANVIFDGNPKLEIPDITFYIVPSLKNFDCLLGMNALHQCTLQLAPIPRIFINEFSINEPLIKINNFCLKSDEKGTKIFCLKDSFIPPLSTQHVEIKLESKDLSKRNKVQLLPELQNNLLFASEYARDSGRLIKIQNNSPEGILLENNCELGIISKSREEDFEFDLFCNFLTSKDDLNDIDRKVLEKEVKEWNKQRKVLLESVDLTPQIENIVLTCSEEVQQGLRDTLKKYHYIFSRHSEDSGLNHNFVVDLQLKDSSKSPKYIPPYRLDHEQSKALDTKIAEMLKNGIIQESLSSYNSPIILIKKKNNSWRMVTNFKKSVNENPMIPSFPIPNVRLIFRKISDTITEFNRSYPGDEIVFFQSDIKHGFYSLALKYSDRHLTAFVCKNRQFQYCRLAQGLASSPSIFQKFTSEIFSDTYFDDFKSKFRIFIYIDDVFAIMPLKYHNFCVEKILQRASEYNILLSLEKSFFCKRKLEFLGYIITKEGIEIPKPKIETLLELEYPKTCKKAMGFCGAFVYFQRLIPRVQQLLAPIQDAIPLKQNFKLTDAMKVAIDKLKNLVRKNGKGDHLDVSGKNDKSIFLATDASLAGCGYVLGNCQYMNNKISSVTISHFGSKKFPKNVQFLSSRCRELIAISYALLDFQDLLDINMHFYIFSDHKSLVKIKENDVVGRTSVGTRIRKALAVLMEYSNAEIIHISNTHYLIQTVDGISRSFSADIENEIPENITINNLNLPSALFKKSKFMIAQQNDPFLKPIYEKIVASAFPIVFNKKFLLAKEDLIYFQNNQGQALIYVPETLSEEICDFVHHEQLHCGQERLIHVLRKSNLYIKNLTNIAQKICTFCVFCQVHFPTKFRNPPDVYFPVVPALRPFNTVYIDLMHVSYKSSHYILTFFDQMTRFSDHEILTNKSADTVIKNLVLLLLKWNCPIKTAIVADHGPEFFNSKLKELLFNMGINLSHSSTYNSRPNLAERVHKEIRKILIALGTDHSNFKYNIQLAFARYNSSIQKNLGYMSPLECLTGLQSRPYFHFPQENSETDETDLPEDLNSLYVQNWVDFLDVLQNSLSQYNYDKFILSDKIDNRYDIHDIVLVRTPRIELSKTRHYPLEGPFRILRKNKNVYSLEHCLSGQRILRNGRFLIKMRMSDELKQKLLRHDPQIINQISPSSDISPFLRFDFKSSKKLELDQQNKPSHYNLRTRT